MSTEPEERDLAHEADMRALMKQQLRDNISPEEAAESEAEQERLREVEARDEFIEGYDGDGGPWCACSVEYSIEELDGNQCDCCGKDIV